jgi:3',5'-cyclic AMP phosphodiesterase CpdA
MGGKYAKLGVAIVAAAVVAVAVYLGQPTAAAPRPDLKPAAHWVFDVPGVDGNRVADRAGQLPGTLLGSPRLADDAPAPRLELSGPSDGVLVKDRVTPGAAILPKEALSLVAWVRVDEPSEWGGIVGCFQDNGASEYGFVLGYNKTGFSFGLATHTTQKLTYLTGKTNYERGRWYHVAGVYDGKQMRLYVNGQLDATSDDQKGPVLYAKSAPLVIGRYRDDDEDFPLAGAIREVMLCHHAVGADDLAAHFTADKQLAELPSVIPPGPRFVVEPYLQFATRSTMTVMWELEAPATAALEYGPAFPPKLVAKLEKPDTMGEVVLRDLEPGTKYFYRVVCTDAEGRRLEGRPRTFMTASGPDDAFSFAVVGDTQRNPAVTAQVAKLMWERRPNFVVHCSDVVDDGAAKWQWTGDLFKPCHELFGRVAVFPCIGNHEKNHEHYYKYFSLPNPEYYYSFRYGNAEFFVTDTNTRRDLSEKGEQYKWLDKALAASEAKWKVCFHHHPPYSSDDNDFGDSWRGPTTAGDVRLRDFVKLYEKHNVDLVLNGHIHVYERTWPIRGGKVDQKTGVVYLTSGGGGGRLENFAPTPAFFKEQFRSDFHFCYATVHRGTLTVKAFDHEGRLFDQFSLQKE